MSISARPWEPPAGGVRGRDDSTPFLEEVHTVRSKTLAILILAAAGTCGTALAALPPQPVATCTIGGTITGTTTLVYAGATAVNVSINAAATNLYGPPLSSC